MNQQQLKTALSKPQEAIQDYLDGLLHDATSRAKALDETSGQPTVLVKTVEPDIVPAAEVAPIIVPALVEEPLEVVDQLDSMALDDLPEIVSKSQWGENGRPLWADESFECLLFKVGGLKLAVPLVELGTIYPLEEELTPLFGQPDWFLGLYKHSTRSIRVVDTAQWVMPERYDADLNQGLKYIISLQGCDWALAVHEVAEAIKLDPEAVRWRTERSKRPWLAGTVIKEMCALLDVGSLSKLIAEAEGQGKTIRAN
ncbi:chemotaxis protein CheW [Aestuariirhabdus sp. Z084]|uniref:chemotaxis protein CheW n=1 Tax=Aestuariirhabdus haliotis TaxID=2918751 RepID=UPI00201B45ED|nr:chemotaxis protein CheW [Aestuariirhabdus haliotis]MCL6414486.1 chemotaxis protein CheW [Aestuariirhabdus haliotis]MCL6418532.1 chemotaxis protein CheW [Aestuariirhabdus haliotis]